MFAVESEATPDRSRQRDLARIVATALLILLFTVGPARAGNDACSRLSAIRASDLLAIPGVNPWPEFLPPGVRCTLGPGIPEPPVCALRRTITRDRMLGSGRRLLLVRATPPNGKSSDYVFVFGCVDRRLQLVFGDRFVSGAKIEFASPARITIRGSFKPDNPVTLTKVYWDADWQEYLSTPFLRGAPAPAPPVKCDDLASAKPSRLVAIPRDGFSHGFGCYSDDPDLPSLCSWKASLTADLMLGNKRRLVLVWDNHRRGTGAWYCLYVFSCLNGRVGPVFDDRFLYVLKIDHASPDHLLLSRAGEQMKYSWNREVQSYLLKSVHISK